MYNGRCLGSGLAFSALSAKQQLNSSCCFKFCNISLSENLRISPDIPHITELQDIQFKVAAIPQFRTVARLFVAVN
jgi:hypothetical protein